MKDSLTVLLVDDEERFLATTAIILQRKGINTMCATCGEEALQHMQSAPDVVVLDVRLPGMDGEATLQRMKTDFSHIPVIMLTGHGELPSAERAVELGAYDYLTKPTDLDLLAVKIREAARFGGARRLGLEKSVGDLMLSLEDCVVLPPDAPLEQALRQMLVQKGTNGKALDRQLLVMKDGEVVGVVTMREMADIVRPQYLVDPEFRSQSAGTTWRFSHIFWNGLFRQRLQELIEKPLSAVMTLPPPLIPVKASLMEACDLLQETSARSLLVMDGAVVAGMLDEQTLFAEMVRLLAATLEELP